MSKTPLNTRQFAQRMDAQNRFSSRITFKQNTTFNQPKGSDDIIDHDDDEDPRDPYSYDSRLQDGFDMMNND